MYVLEAVIELQGLKRRELHNIERPIAYLAFQTAEMNRDTKKRKQPFSPEDFYYYSDAATEALPEGRYGAAAIELIRRELYPRWALFVYNSLKARASEVAPPSLLCLQCDDAILLAPEFSGNIVTGMLIAQRSASEQVREMKTEDGRGFRLRVPRVAGKFEAIEDTELNVL